MTRATTILSLLAACVLAVCAGAAQNGNGVDADHSHDNRSHDNHWAKHAALNDVPESAVGRSNPFGGVAREAMAGGKLFQEHCADCHGAKGGGTRQGPPLLAKEVEEAKPGALFWVLTNGSVWHGMPVWSKLPEPERWQIVTFLQSMNGHPVSSIGQ